MHHPHPSSEHDHDHEHGHRPHWLAHSPLGGALDWMEGGTVPSLVKIACLVVAGASPWLPLSAAAAAATRTAAISLVYALCAPSAALDLCTQLAAGEVDTHVLTSLAAAGTALTGHAAEVC